MPKVFAHQDTFLRNIILTFSGTTVANALHLACQLVIAHKLTASDFAAFNTLLSVFILLSSPLTTLQTGVVKYVSAFNAQKNYQGVASFIRGLLQKAMLLAAVTFSVLWLASPGILARLKVTQVSSGYILALLVGVSWITPIYLGSVQGLELFRWFAVIAIAAAISKVVFAFVFLSANFSVTGALAAFLLSAVLATVLGYLVIQRHLGHRVAGEAVNYRQLCVFLIPVGFTTVSFLALSNIDMVLVRYFFSAEISGRYSIAQMVGKIFLFLPSAVSLVMFPRSSGLHAQKDQTSAVLYKSLAYAGILCILATLFFNAFPAFVLRVLTGKVFPESILLGRLFGVSMSFFALSYIMMMYFLSINDTRFIPVVLGCVVLELIGILLFHQSLIQIQATLCAVAAMLFTATIVLSRTKP